jgi:Transposase IS4
LEDVQFEPFLLGDHREPKLNIPSNIDPAKPLALLDLFIPPKIYISIAENTNLYAIAQNAPTTRSSTNSRYWYPTNEYEIRVLFGIFYYMGVYREPNFRIYWEIPRPNGPIHAISQHMSLNRFENLRRYLHVSPLTTVPPLEPCIESHDPSDAEIQSWWAKLEPMLSTFRIACQEYFIPGTEVAIDEIMVRFYGRLSDTCKMPNKPIKQGYKIFALADNGYVWHFQLSSKHYGIAELHKVDELLPTGSMVLQMARLLPKFPNSHYVLYLDNYFTSIPLFSMLRKENIGAVGTTRPLGIDFPALLTILRKNWSTKLDWGTTVADIVNDVLCIGWQDNNFVLGLSTVHTVHKASSWVTSKRNRLSKTSTNASITQKVFKDLPLMLLDILAFINDYNHYMNSVDLANQHRQPYDTQRIAYRTWIPLLHWILDQAAINAYKLALVAKTWQKNDHSAYLEFRQALYDQLLDYSKFKKPRLWREPGPHNWVERSVRQRCVMCTAKEQLKKKLLEDNKDTCIWIFKEIANSRIELAKSQSGCSYCDVALCKTSSCFQDWHTQRG